MIYSGFMLGLIGSLHCIGMCGPLTLLLPKANYSKFKFVLGRVLYNLGRITTYAILGFFIGTIGESLGLFISQKTLALALGITILLFIVLTKMFNLQLNIYGNIAKFTSIIKSNLKINSNKFNLINQLIFGFLNGFLPCGLLYGALSAAFLMETKLQSSLFMISFGIGTLPLMFIASMGFGVLSNFLRIKAKNIIPITYSIVAIWLILRGLSIPIPSIYTPPSIDKPIECHSYKFKSNF